MPSHGSAPPPAARNLRPRRDLRPRRGLPPPKRLRLALDTPMYPHLLDNILALSDYTSLLALRRVNRNLLEQVDARLASTLCVRAPASKMTPGMYIYTDLGGPHAHPALAFYPYASDAPYTAKIEAEEEQWVSTADEEFGDDHWAWNYAQADWERGWGGWAACTRPTIPSFGDTSRPLPPPIRPKRANEYVSRPGFKRKMRAGEIARAHDAAVRVCAAVRELLVVGPIGLEGSRLFQLMRSVRSVRIERSARGEMIPKVPVPAPLVHTFFALSSVQRRARTQPRTIVGTRLIEGAPRLIEGVRTLTIDVVTGGSCLMVPFARPHSLREVVYVLHAPPEEEDAGPHRRFGLLHDVLEHGALHADDTTITVVGLDHETGAALMLDGDDEGVRDEFEQKIRSMLRAKADAAAGDGRPWPEERVGALLAGVRLLSREEWEAERAE